MNINFNLSKDSYLKFFKQNVIKTIQFKKAILNYSILTILSLTPVYLYYNSFPYKQRLVFKIFLFLLVFIFIINLKKLILFSCCRSLKKRETNLYTIFLNSISLTINNNILNLKSQYEDISIPFDKITGIYIVNNFIFITNSICKDILIPLTIFDSEKNKNNFISNFENFSINKSFPKNYKFI
ncbi:hypothetical protein GCM10008903_03420 [Clostridium cadaveris]